MCASWHCREASLLVKHALRTSVLLLIRWFRVRPPGAPPEVLIVFRVGSWTDETAALEPAALVLPSHRAIGSWRAKVCAGKDRPGDPVPEGSKTEVGVEAQIELGKLGIKEVRKVRGQLLDTLYAPAEVRRISGPPSAAGGPCAAARRGPARCTHPNRRRCPRSARVAGACRRPSLPHPSR